MKKNNKEKKTSTFNKEGWEAKERKQKKKRGEKQQ